MRYFYVFFAMAMLALGASAAEVRVKFADKGLGSGSLVSKSPIKLNDDVELSFEKGGAMADPSITAAGKITLTQKAVMKVRATDAEVLITKIVLTSAKKSETFSTGAAECNPAGTFAIDKEALTSTWSDATGSNSVHIVSAIGAPAFNEICVTYTGTGGDTPGPDIPEDPDKPGASDNMLDNPLATAEGFATLTVINIDPDTYTWQYDKNANCAYIRNDFSTTADRPKDDWLITKGLDLKAGSTYRLTMVFHCGNAGYDEKLASYLGSAPTPEGMTRKLAGVYNVTNTYGHKNEASTVLSA